MAQSCTWYFKEIVRARIRRFESDHPSHAVVSSVAALGRAHAPRARRVGPNPRNVETDLSFPLSSEEGLEVAALATVLGEVVAMAITVAAVALDAVVAAVVLDAVVVAKIFLAFCVLWIWA